MSRQINRKSLRLLLTGMLPRVLVPEPPNRRNPRKEGKLDQRFLGFYLIGIIRILAGEIGGSI